MPLDKKKLALIHIVKKELDIPDQDYRDTLQRVAGVRSSKDLDDAGFRRLMNHFVRSRHYRVNDTGMTVRQKLYIQSLVERLEWTPDHFRNFLKKYHHQADLNRLHKSDASAVIESLKHILAHRH